MNFKNIDININIVSFIDNITDFQIFRRICRSTYIYRYKPNFVCRIFNEDAIIEQVDLSLSNYYYDFENIIKTEGGYIRWLICSTYITNEHLQYMSNLRYVDFLNNTNINDSCISYIPKIIGISSGESDISDFTNFGNLILLDCDNNVHINDNTFKLLSKLLYLSCGSCDLSDEIFQYIPNLIYLDCGITSFTDRGIIQLKNIKTLKCGSTNITDCGINKLHSLISLSCESLNITNITLKNLTFLDCGDSQITDESLEHMTLLKNLICSKNRVITNKGISYLPNLTQLDCGLNMNINNFTNNTKLTHLLCGSNTSINDESFQPLTNLIHLDCHRAFINITKKALLYIPNLEYIYYHDSIHFKNEYSSQMCSELLKKLKKCVCRSRYGYDMYLIK
jgi:hypothetical protein